MPYNSFTTRESHAIWELWVTVTRTSLEERILKASLTGVSGQRIHQNSDGRVSRRLCRCGTLVLSLIFFLHLQHSIIPIFFYDQRELFKFLDFLNTVLYCSQVSCNNSHNKNYDCISWCTMTVFMHYPSFENYYNNSQHVLTFLSDCQVYFCPDKLQ